MRILYASERPPYPFFLGGAARAAHMLLVRMAAMPNMVCEAVGSRDYAVSPWRFPDTADHATLGIRSVDPARDELNCGYSVRLLPDFYPTLAAEIERTRPGLVWSQLEGALPVLQTAHRLGVTGLCYVHDAEFALAEMRAIAALDCHLIASSGFLANKVQRATGRRAGVVYPPAELYFDTPGDPEGSVTMINPHPVKGLDTFLEIARRLPAVNFLLQESWKLDDAALDTLHRRLAELPNVRFAHRVSDMRSVYRQTRLLIAPSRWEEGFGMVALEAQSCGIPVIASRRGGLPEAVGDGGLLIDDYLNVDTWVKAIDSVLNDAVHYRTLAERARRHAASDTFAPDALARRLYTIAQSRPERPGWLAQGAFAAQQRARNWPLFGRLLRRLVG
ncbi:MAG: glycosyltransferase family 4 protein [Gammaproteobacteria bacterium]|nr:glycosyltransferase family 4 protein [Gammaproteobacteria bacterium]MBU1409129.1 glycosyltransferase family 4 protein [Gammaproteobacteria bacterium]MBU1531025.1 glycosyltransferase family 4 protein [Gammaproteobacteria bacterium]